jgi:hypothetical protein
MTLAEVAANVPLEVSRVVIRYPSAENPRIPLVSCANEQKDCPERLNLTGPSDQDEAPRQEGLLMAARHYFGVVAVMIAALLVVSLMAMLTRESTGTALSSPAVPLGRNDVGAKVASMRAPHQRVVNAESPAARAALLSNSVQLMDEGVVTMRALKPGLPVTATGEVDFAAITPAESESVQDFIALMEVLIEMKSDQDSVLQAPESQISSLSTAPADRLATPVCALRGRRSHVRTTRRRATRPCLNRSVPVPRFRLRRRKPGWIRTW